MRTRHHDSSRCNRRRRHDRLRATNRNRRARLLRTNFLRRDRHRPRPVRSASHLVTSVHVHDLRLVCAQKKFPSHKCGWNCGIGRSTRKIAPTARPNWAASIASSSRCTSPATSPASNARRSENTGQGCPLSPQARRPCYGAFAGVPVRLGVGVVCGVRRTPLRVIIFGRA
jgi:hypothetical protein